MCFTCLSGYTCALQKDILYQGRMFVSDHWFCFHSKVFGKDTKVCADVCFVSAHRKGWESERESTDVFSGVSRFHASVRLFVVLMLFKVANTVRCQQQQPFDLMRYVGLNYLTVTWRSFTENSEQFAVVQKTANSPFYPLHDTWEHNQEEFSDVK